MFRTIERYEEDGIGLPYPIVLIGAAEEEIDDETGEVVGVSIPNIEGLAASVAIARILHPMQLDGREVRFIRQTIGKNAKEFAQSLHMDQATFSRWENNKQEVGAWADKEVRMAALLLLGPRIPGLKVDPELVVGMSAHRRRAGEPWPEITMVLHPAPREQEPALELSEPDAESWMQMAA